MKGFIPKKDVNRMPEKTIETKFASLLLHWYKEHKRDLPWRNIEEPYRIWLSEIILQQTRVQQGWAYYEKFIEYFPTIDVLAKADEEVVMKAWEGLGYYSRARNLHATAKVIATQYHGNFPETIEELLKLKGIGPYTARAIGAFAFHLPVAVVDGNVYRVLSRVFEQTIPINSHEAKKHYQTLADRLVSTQNPSAYNSALMDLGSLICTPKNPDCEHCPLQSICLAYSAQSWNLFPVKTPKAIRKSIYLCLFWIEQDGKFAVQQKKEGYWKHLWLSPYQECTSEVWEKLPSAITLKHVFTHRDVWIKVIDKPLQDSETEWLWLDKLTPAKSLPKPMFHILKIKNQVF